MSKLKTLIVAVVLGSSSVAMADHSFTASASASASWSFGTPVSSSAVRDVRANYQRVDLRGLRYGRGEHMIFPNNTDVGLGASRYTGPMPAYKRAGQRVALTEATRIDSSVLYLDIDGKLGALSALLFLNTVGTTDISMVKILFRSGAWQVVRGDATLDRATPALHVMVERNEPIERIEIFGDTARGAAFQVMAR